ncbi:MAG: S8 family serine peptidase [Oryzihumus sp.]
MTDRTIGARLLALALAGGLATLGVAATGAQAAPAPKDHGQKGKGTLKAQARGDKLGQHDRQLLAQARQKGTARVTVMLATKAGAAKDVDASVRKLGGWVGYRNDKLGYVRVELPTGNVTKAVALANVLKVDLKENVQEDNPREQSSAAVPSNVSGPGRNTPDSNPYMPTNETGAVAFKQKHPTFDGRGITIGVLDSGVDLDHPALAKTTTGELKITDWVTATDPLTDGDATWRAMLTPASGGSVTYAGATWTLPAGSYRINKFSEAITAGSEPEGDVNRDGDTTDVFGVLYDPSTHDIRVDANQDHDFTDDPVMRPYREGHQVGHFGKDDPATKDVVESMPFVVEYRQNVDLAPVGLPGKADFVNIGIPEDAHATHVAGITAANGMFGGKMNGAAPGAKIVSSRACTWGGGCTNVALTEGMIDLVVNRRVDVVNLSIGGLPALNDGANARAELYNRLIEDYGVQIFISAGNSGPGINTVGDPSVASDAVSVASSVSKETWLANYGSAVSSAMNVHNYSSRGPREDGGFKPNISAPGSAISTVPRWLKQPDVSGVKYSLPAGYAMFNGTSMASPQATGAAALLLSASRATDTPVTPAQLRASLYSTAKFIKGVPAMAQGNGLVDVNAAWTLLSRRPVVQGYATSAPVCTPISQYLTTPNVGTGIYNRCAVGQGGQAAGSSKTYPVTLTRTSGRAGNVTHTLSWVGNDGTFTAPRTVVLPLNKPTTVTVTARPGAGAHSAILQVNDPATPTVDHEVLATVVAPTTLASPSFASTTSTTVQRNLTNSVFVTVPAGAKALQVNLSGIATGSQTRFIAFNPYGVPVEDTSSLGCYTNFSDAKACNPTTRAYADPLPGVWEIEVESRRTSPFLTNPYRLTAAAQGVTVSPATQTLDSVTANTPAPVSWTVTNGFGPVTIQGHGGPLGSAASSRPSITEGTQQEYTVEVPAGATRLDVAIGNTSDVGSDLDLYVYKGTSDDTLVGQSADGDAEESVSLADPEPGTYTVVVTGYAVPSGTTAYDYRDVFYSPDLGTLAVSSSAKSLGLNGSSTISGVLTAQKAPAAGRQLFGEMTVSSSEGAVLGRGSVLIGSVTP